MLLSKFDMYAENQEITDSTASETVIDMIKAGDPLNDPLTLFVKVGGSFTGGGSLSCELQTSDDSNFATKKVLARSGDFSATELKNGATILEQKVHKGYLRYARVYFNVDGDLFTAGNVNAFYAK
ncbi:Bbp16 family capsid cement protein [Lentisphaerota bacterium WC36G]|nr:hypothetical protein LJT99_07560 [Lentisphaerae bacterium WC36]